MLTIKPSSKWLTSSFVRAVFGDVVAERKGTGKETIDLSEGDPTLWGFTYQELSNYLIDAANDGWAMYPDLSPWETRLRASIVDFEKKYRGVEYAVDDVILASGVAAIMKVLHYAILGEGDEVVTCDPSHYLGGPTSYWSYFGAKPIPCRTLEDEDWKPDIDEMVTKITDKTKAIFINSPNNPTGAVYDDKILREIINVAGQYDIPVISDEIYGLICYDGTISTSVSKISKEIPVFMLSGMSKIFMRPGWRLGYMCIHDPNNSLADVKGTIKMVAGTYGDGTTCMATPILAAAANAYRYGVEYGLKEPLKMVRELQLRKDYTMKRINAMTGISCCSPKGALYAFPKIHGIGKIWQSDSLFLLDLLKEEGVLLHPGSSYGKLGQSHVRSLILPSVEVLENVYNKLDRFLKKRETV